jgi:SSS family solute:Na+ symporter
MAISLQGGIAALTAALPAERYFSLIARGPAVDMGAGLSLILGVITTQAYIQAVIAARSLRLAKVGLFISAALIPVIGIAGIAVGLYMKLHFPAINPASALPLFILTFLPPLYAGMVLAILLVTVVGTAAGVALGLSTMFCSDIYRVYYNLAADSKTLLTVSRVALACALTAAALVALGNLGSLILGWSFMSMGLRGAVAFGILTSAIFAPGRIPRAYAMWSMVIGPACIIAGKPFISGDVDPLLFGVSGSLAILIIGGLAAHGKKR